MKYGRKIIKYKSLNAQDLSIKRKQLKAVVREFDEIIILANTETLLNERVNKNTWAINTEMLEQIRYDCDPETSKKEKRWRCYVTFS